MDVRYTGTVKWPVSIIFQKQTTKQVNNTMDQTNQTINVPETNKWREL